MAFFLIVRDCSLFKQHGGVARIDKKTLDDAETRLIEGLNRIGPQSLDQHVFRQSLRQSSKTFTMPL